MLKILAAFKKSIKMQDSEETDITDKKKLDWLTYK